jgi:membrane protein DedA with SNARE-associated domain
VKIVPLLLAAAALVAAGVLAWRRRWWWAAAAVVAVAVLAVYGSGVVHLPSVEKMLTDLGSRLGNWTYLLVGVLAFLETSAFVGLVAPGEVAVVFGGFVAGQGAINAVVLWVIVWFCAAAGDSTGYVLGRKLGRTWALTHGARIGVTAPRFEALERFFQRHGGKTILIGRFIGFFRSLGPFVAGSARVPYGRFLAASLTGAGLWSAVFVALGYIFWRSFHRALSYVQQGNTAFGALVVIAAAVYGLYRLWRSEDARARARKLLGRVIGREDMEDIDAARDGDP